MLGALPAFAYPGRQVQRTPAGQPPQIPRWHQPCNGALFIDMHKLLPEPTIPTSPLEVPDFKARHGTQREGSPDRVACRRRCDSVQARSRPMPGWTVRKPPREDRYPSHPG